MGVCRPQCLRDLELDDETALTAALLARATGVAVNGGLLRQLQSVVDVPIDRHSDASYAVTTTLKSECGPTQR